MTSVVDEILERERIFRDFHVWPVANRLDLTRWLSNFDEEDREMAARLADGFLYFSDDILTSMLRASLQNLSNRLLQSGRFDTASLIECDRVAFVKVEGERPNLTDSGNLISRKIRAFGVPETRILSPRQALATAGDYDLFVFFDDIVGSGGQLRHTWKKVHVFGPDSISFESVAQANHGEYACCCAIATQLGVSVVRGEVAGMNIHAAHLLPTNASLTDPDCPVWRNLDYDSGIAFIQRYGIRAGFDQGDEWAGFGALALRLAFDHGTPDSTLPIFSSTRNGWRPLVRAAQ